MTTIILTKVQKLINLGTNTGASEGERENALRMAHNLLIKHNLSMEDLDGLKTLEERIDMPYEAWSMQWSGQLAVSISRLFLCKVYKGNKVNGTKSKLHFVGRVSNVTTAKMMHEYLVDSILKECRKNWRHNLAPESRSFALGASSKIFKRVMELMEKPSEEILSSGTSLAVVQIYKVEEEANSAFLKSVGVNLIKGKQNSKVKNILSDAYNQGKTYGAGVSLNGQVSSSSTAYLN
jgi:hypothetical protein